MFNITTQDIFTAVYILFCAAAVLVFFKFYADKIEAMRDAWEKFNQQNENLDNRINSAAKASCELKESIKEVRDSADAIKAELIESISGDEEILQAALEKYIDADLDKRLHEIVQKRFNAQEEEFAKNDRLIRLKARYDSTFVYRIPAKICPQFMAMMTRSCEENCKCYSRIAQAVAHIILVPCVEMNDTNNYKSAWVAYDIMDVDYKTIQGNKYVNVLHCEAFRLDPDTGEWFRTLYNISMAPDSKNCYTTPMLVRTFAGSTPVFETMADLLENLFPGYSKLPKADKLVS
jgi:mRNA-degrading endonuclease HigB of HigAB toxin-antitoxin module